MILMHSYLVEKLQAENGNADTRCGKRKFIDDGISWIEATHIHTSTCACTYTHTHTAKHKHFKKAADPLSQ